MIDIHTSQTCYLNTRKYIQYLFNKCKVFIPSSTNVSTFISVHLLLFFILARILYSCIYKYLSNTFSTLYWFLQSSCQNNILWQTEDPKCFYSYTEYSFYVVNIFTGRWQLYQLYLQSSVVRDTDGDRKVFS